MAQALLSAMASVAARGLLAVVGVAVAVAVAMWWLQPAANTLAPAPSLRGANLMLVTIDSCARIASEPLAAAPG